MISVKNLNHYIQYAQQNLHILDGIDFQINDGESVAITGSSGSGKTTLLAMLAGLDVPSSGGVYIGQDSLSVMDEDQRAQFRAAQVGFVFQSFHLLDALTALENVLLPLELAGDFNGVDQATAFLEKVGLGHRMQHYPNQLSGGEQQRVAIARAFASKPRYLFADEPTGNLDEKTSTTIINLLFELNQLHQTTLVLVTHEARLAQRCQRQFVIENGRLTELDFDKRPMVMGDADV